MKRGHGSRVKDGVKATSRRQSRRKAFELLFELEQHPGIAAEAILERTFEHPAVLEVFSQDEDGEGYVVLPIQLAKNGNGCVLAPGGEAARTFISELVRATKTHEEALDNELSKSPQEWSYDRIGVPERVLLRLAMAEMVYIGTSYKVVINEILDLAKLYAQEAARPFINGILGAIVRNLDNLRKAAARSGQPETNEKVEDSQ